MRILKDAGLVIASTVGAGIFALPYIFAQSGFALGVFYMVVLGAIIVFAHTLYWRVLDITNERERLLGLTRRYLGVTGYVFGAVVIVAGLTLALSIHLILGLQFLQVFVPAAGVGVMALFWLVSIASLFFRERRVLFLERLGSFGIALIVALIFFSGNFSAVLPHPALSLGALFLPFGIVLFSLAGWTAVEPLYEAHKKQKRASWKLPFALGTAIAALPSRRPQIPAWCLPETRH